MISSQAKTFNHFILEETVTVVIPVLNAENELGPTLEALFMQTYPKELTEVIIVDNGSSDGTINIAKKFTYRLLYETRKKGPYAARNKGLRETNSEIIALVDANKKPAENWLEEGVKALKREKADLAGGDILFELGDSPSVSEIVDAITYNNNRKLVQYEQGSAAGNLFFRRKVLEKIGYFPVGFRSGMDIWWTQQAVRNGFKLIFAEDACVYCKPRKFLQVMRKSFRVGTTHPFNMKQAGQSLPSIFISALRTFAPPRLKPIREHRVFQNYSVSLLQVFWVAWYAKKMMGLGRLAGFCMLPKMQKTFSDG